MQLVSLVKVGPHCSRTFGPCGLGNFILGFCLFVSAVTESRCSYGVFVHWENIQLNPNFPGEREQKDDFPQ